MKNFNTLYQFNPMVSLILFLVISGIVKADQNISDYRTTPVISNGVENVHVTDNGTIFIAAGGGSNFAIQIKGNFLAGKTLLNDGNIETQLDNSGGEYSVPILLYKVISYGEIINNGTIVSRVADQQLAYPVYISENGPDGVVRNNGSLFSISGKDSWGVAINIRNNLGSVVNAPGAFINVKGRDGTWLYGLVSIVNHEDAIVTNQGVVQIQSEKDGGGGTGLYAWKNFGEVINEGVVNISVNGTNKELYGIGVNHNYGTIRNRGQIVLQSLIGNKVWAFHNDDGNGTVINDRGAVAYGDIYTIGQHFENRGDLYLFSKGVSATDYYHGYNGSVLGINVSLDSNHRALYSTVQTKGTILESGSKIVVNVETPLSEQHYLLNQRLDGVIQTDNNLTVLGAPIVTDNSALLGWWPEYDASDLDLVPYKEASFSEAVRRGSCTLGALGVAGTLDRYSYGSDSDLDTFVNTLYVLPELEQVAEGVHSSIPFSSFQSVMANREISRRLMYRMRSLSIGVASGDLNASRGLWLELFGGKLRQDCSNGYRGYDADFSGVMIGGDRSVGSDHRMGIALMLGGGELQTRGLPQSEDFDRYDLMIYGHYLPGWDWRLDYQLGLGYVQSREERTLLYLDRHTSARHLEWMGYGSMELSKAFYREGALELESGASVSFVYGDMQGFTEEGAGGLDVSVAGSTDKALYLGWRGRLRYTHPGELQFELEGGVDYDLLHRSLRTSGNFQGYSSGKFPMELNYDNAWGYHVNVSLAKRLAQNVEFSLKAGYSGRENGYRDYDFSAGLRWKF